MATIGFIGLGHMGLPMARNLLKAGHAVQGFDVSTAAVARLRARPGGTGAGERRQGRGRGRVRRHHAARGPACPGGLHGPGRRVRRGAAGALLIDCSTIDVETARTVAAAAAARGFAMVDAPVSGGVAGAEAGDA